MCWLHCPAVGAGRTQCAQTHLSGRLALGRRYRQLGPADAHAISGSRPGHRLRLRQQRQVDVVCDQLSPAPAPARLATSLAHSSAAHPAPISRSPICHLRVVSARQPRSRCSLRSARHGRGRGGAALQCGWCVVAGSCGCWRRVGGVGPTRRSLCGAPPGRPLPVLPVNPGQHPAAPRHPRLPRRLCHWPLSALATLPARRLTSLNPRTPAPAHTQAKMAIIKVAGGIEHCRAPVRTKDGKETRWRPVPRSSNRTSPHPRLFFFLFPPLSRSPRPLRVQTWPRFWRKRRTRAPRSTPTTYTTSAVRCWRVHTPASHPASSTPCPPPPHLPFDPNPLHPPPQSTSVLTIGWLRTASTSASSSRPRSRRKRCDGSGQPTTTISACPLAPSDPVPRRTTRRSRPAVAAAESATESATASASRRM